MLQNILPDLVLGEKLVRQINSRHICIAKIIRNFARQLEHHLLPSLLRTVYLNCKVLLFITAKPPGLLFYKGKHYCVWSTSLLNILNMVGEKDQHVRHNQLPPLDDHERGSRPICLKSTIQEFLFVISTTIAFAQESFFAGLTVGLTAVIGHDLGMSIAQITWITAGCSSVIPRLSYWMEQN